MTSNKKYPLCVHTAIWRVGGFLGTVQQICFCEKSKIFKSAATQMHQRDSFSVQVGTEECKHIKHLNQNLKSYIKTISYLVLKRL